MQTPHYHFENLELPITYDKLIEALNQLRQTDPRWGLLIYIWNWKPATNKEYRLQNALLELILRQPLVTLNEKGGWDFNLDLNEVGEVFPVGSIPYLYLFVCKELVALHNTGARQSIARLTVNAQNIVSIIRKDQTLSEGTVNSYRRSYSDLIAKGIQLQGA